MNKLFFLFLVVSSVAHANVRDCRNKLYINALSMGVQAKMTSAAPKNVRQVLLDIEIFSRALEGKIRDLARTVDLDGEETGMSETIVDNCIQAISPNNTSEVQKALTALGEFKYLLEHLDEVKKENNAPAETVAVRQKPTLRP